jgi:hypothetical protein
MAEVRFHNGSWYVVYADGRNELCHNHATAEYLANAHNAAYDVADATSATSFTATFNDPVPA